MCTDMCDVVKSSSGIRDGDGQIEKVGKWAIVRRPSVHPSHCSSGLRVMTSVTLPLGYKHHNAKTQHHPHMQNQTCSLGSKEWCCVQV
jgi:hypothetical protein